MYTWCFVLNSKATSEIYTNVHTLALHDALPIARHRAVDLRRRVARRRREGRAAATPQGRADAAGACAAGALLLPRLLAAAAYFALGELSLGARARSEERRVGKECVVRVDLGGRRIIKKKKNEKTADADFTDTNIDNKNDHDNFRTIKL